MKQSKTIKEYQNIISGIHARSQQTKLTDFELQQHEAYVNQLNDNLFNNVKAKRSFRTPNNISITIPSTRDQVGSPLPTNASLNFDDAKGWRLNPSATEILSHSNAQSQNFLRSPSYRPGKRQTSIQFSVQTPSFFQAKKKLVLAAPEKSPKVTKSEIALIPHHSKTLLLTYGLEPYQKSAQLTHYSMEKLPTSVKVGIERPAQAAQERRRSLQRDLNADLMLYNQEFKRKVLDKIDCNSPTLLEKRPSQSISSPLAFENTLTFSSINTQPHFKTEPSNLTENFLTVQTEVSENDSIPKSPKYEKSLLQALKLPLYKILKKDNLIGEKYPSEEDRAFSKRSSHESVLFGDLPESIAQKITKIKEKPFKHIPDWMLSKGDCFEGLKVCREEQRHKLVNILRKEASLRKYAEISILTRFLQGVVVFSGFNPQHLMELTEKMKLQYYKKGAYICHQYDAAKEIWIIIEGTVEISNHEGFLAFAGSGDLLGRQALDNQTVRSASLAVISTEAFVASISAEDFKTFLSSKHYVEITLSDKKEFLESLPVFRLLRNEYIYRVAFHLSPKKFFKNEVVYHKNDVSRQFYILYSGAVHRETEMKIAQVNRWPIATNEWRQRRMKRVVQVRVPLRVGDFFGYKETFTNMLRKEKVVASEESVVFILTRELIEKLLEPEDIYLMLKYLDDLSKKKKNLIREKLIDDKKNQQKKIEFLQSASPQKNGTVPRASVESQGKTRKFDSQKVSADGGGIASRASMGGK